MFQNLLGGKQSHNQIIGSRTPQGKLRLAVPMSPLELSVIPTFSTTEARGSPSRWLRKGDKSDKDFRQKLCFDRLCNELTSRDSNVRHKAAESLADLSKGDSFAASFASNIQPVLRGLKPNEIGPVKLALLGALRSLAEKGHAISVALHASALVPCFRDQDILVQRKVSALYRVLAEEGAASMVAQDVKSIMHCFEATKANGVPLAAPLDALSAIAVAGEGTAVASVIAPLLASLKDSRPKIRKSACATLGAIAGGAKELLGPLGLSADAEGRGQATLFEMLVCTALDDQDDDVRLEAADALRCLPEADPDACDQTRQKFPQLVRRLRSKPYRDRRGLKGEAMKIVSGAMGIPCETEKTLEDLEGTLCAICFEPFQTDGRWCPAGDPHTLHCGHIFHHGCCHEWFEWVKRCGRVPSCPVCRAVGHKIER